MNMYVHGTLPDCPQLKVHELKCDPTSFAQIAAGNKKAEVRFDDRNYCVGDMLWLRETAYNNLGMKLHGQPLEYTGRDAYYTVTHIQRGYSLPTDLVVMSIEHTVGFA
jgi:Domain of unknown function (DUF3850)